MRGAVPACLLSAAALPTSAVHGLATGVPGMWPCGVPGPTHPHLLDFILLWGSKCRTVVLDIALGFPRVEKGVKIVCFALPSLQASSFGDGVSKLCVVLPLWLCRMLV